jgi:hypothetical protein
VSSQGKQGRSRPRARIVAIAAAVVLAFGAIVAAPSVPAAEAADGSLFNPGSIISDAVFYNGTAMSSGEIQAFIDSKVSSCSSGAVCLESYRENAASRSANQHCSAFSGGSNLLASEIIARVAVACGVNPQVLIVLLEKEQSLVTSSSPSSGRYLRATGYGCPDTAECDTQYFGFTNQVYQAAQQFKRYQANPNGYNYRAGRTNSILFHPNGACGAQPVYIENQATAGLYNYTPYQPNAAALANLYGTGDGCSSYGNRNFWRIFTDWFGNTQGTPFARSASNPTIYLLSGSVKFPVPDMATWSNFAALGGYRVVSDSVLAGYSTGNPLGNIVRNAATGEIYLTDLGVKYHVQDCADIAAFGLSCSGYNNLLPSQTASLKTGPALGEYIRDAATGRIYSVADGTKTWIRTLDELYAITGGVVPPFADLGPTLLASIPDSASATTGDLLRDGGKLYVVDDGAVLVPISAVFATSSKLPASRTLTAAIRAVTTIDPSRSIGLLASCSGTTMMATGTGLRSITAGAELASLGQGTAIGSGLCAAIGAGSASAVPAVASLVRDRQSLAVYNVFGGQKRHVSTMDELFRIAGATGLNFIEMSAAALEMIPNAGEMIYSTQLVKSPNDATVYWVDGSTLIPIANFDVAEAFGVTGYSVISQGAVDRMTKATAVLSTIVRCPSGNTWIAGGGQITKLANAAATGLPVTDLSPSSCDRIRSSGQTIAGPLLLREPRSGDLYLIKDGTKQYLATMDAVRAVLAGNQEIYITASPSVIAAIPAR